MLFKDIIWLQNVRGVSIVSHGFVAAYRLPDEHSVVFSSLAGYKTIHDSQN